MPGSVTIHSDGGVWRTISPGIERKILLFDRETKMQSSLIRSAKGAVFPAHEHEMVEECVILEGSVRLGSIELSAGDYQLMAPGMPHIAAVSDTGALMFVRGERRATLS